MSDKLTLDDVEQDVHERDEEGELLPVEHDIEYNGQEKTVKTVPITIGAMNKLSHVDEEISNLHPPAVLEALQTLYVEPDFSGWTEEKVEAYDGERLGELLSPLEDKVDGEFDGGEGNPADMSRSERARQMRNNG